MIRGVAMVVAVLALFGQFVGATQGWAISSYLRNLNEHYHRSVSSSFDTLEMTDTTAREDFSMRVDEWSLMVDGIAASSASGYPVFVGSTAVLIWSVFVLACVKPKPSPQPKHFASSRPPEQDHNHRPPLT